jgi:FKBP-type peptidyl-prolyl cis-trans isomerase FkpA
MKLQSRNTVLTITLLALAVSLGACKPADKSASSDSATATETADVNAIPGLPTEKERVSYVIGQDIAKTLDPIKGEVDVDTITKAIKTSFSGDKPLLTEAQGVAIREAFGKRMQAKQLADQQAAAAKNQKEGDDFLAANGKKPEVKTTASGLQYQVLREGSGPKPKLGDTIKVNYLGTTLDGKKFDSSYDRGQPAEFKVGGVIPGWNEGMQLLSVGSKYVLWVPSKLAYGPEGTQGGPIGPNATLKFEVELLSIDAK